MKPHIKKKDHLWWCGDVVKKVGGHRIIKTSLFSSALTPMESYHWWSMSNEISDHGAISAKLESKGLKKTVKVRKKESPAKSRASFTMGESILLGAICLIIGFGLGLCI